LKKQKEDYEKCLESVTQLTHQLDSAMAVRIVRDAVRCSAFASRAFNFFTA